MNRVVGMDFEVRQVDRKDKVTLEIAESDNGDKVALPARESMVVFWDGEESPGFLAYGLSRPGPWNGGPFPVDLWPKDTEAEPWVLYGDRWQVFLWTVRLPAFPSNRPWTEAAHKSLEWIINGGCKVAWLGAEGLPFCDPPSLFSPTEMQNGVIAALRSSGEFLCPLDPDEPMRFLTDAEMAQLRTYAVGLADAPD
jgi:hypothetical protein